jgi:hypothetical protein
MYRSSSETISRGVMTGAGEAGSAVSGNFSVRKSFID